MIKNLSLRNKLLLIFIPLFIVSILSAGLFFRFYFKKQLIAQLHVEAEEQSRLYSTKVESILNKYLAVIKSQAAYFADYKSLPENIRRETFCRILESYASSTSDIKAVWTIWEPNTIDSYDNLYKNHLMGIGDVGAFGCNILLSNGKVELTPTFSTDYLGEFHSGPKKILTDYFTEPYFYSYTGEKKDEVLEASIVTPIISEGTFLGTIGIDLKLAQIQQLIDTIKPYETGYAILLSASAKRLAQFKHEMVGRSFFDQNNLSKEQNDYVRKSMEEAKPFFLEKIAYSTGIHSYQYYTPIFIGNFSKPLYFGIIVPTEVFVNQADELTAVFFVASLIFLAIGVVAIFYYSNRITAPIKKLQISSEEIAKGNFDVIIPDFDADEVGSLAKSFRTMAEKQKQFISSLNSANERFILAQKSARITSREYWLGSNKLVWSSEIDDMFSMPKIFTIDTFDAFMSRIHPDDADEYFAKFQSAVQFHTYFQYEFRFRLSDGTYRWLRDEGNFFTRNIQEAVPRYIGIIQDITSRKSFEDEQKRLAAVIEQSLDIVIIYDKTKKIVYINKAFETISGMSRNAFIGSNSLLLTDNNDKSISEKDIFFILDNEGTFNCESYFKINQDKLTLELSFFTVEDEFNEVSHYVQIVRNITDKKGLESRIQQAQKMEAIGILAGGIAHDFNNLLTAIITSAELARMSTKDDNISKYVDMILKASARAKGITSQILTFSRMKEQERTPVNINYIIKEIKSLLAETIPPHINIHFYQDEPNAFVLADPGQIHQVIMNLCTNAYQAMKDKGSLIEIRIKSLSIEDQISEGFSKIKPGNYILLTVSDDGPGIHKDILPRIFDPFFTTKKVGEGTGLGLSVAHGIVTGHGGYISVYSELSYGSTFNVYLPLIEGSAIITGSQTDEMEMFGTEHIVVVDDESMIAETTKLLLENFGYIVDAFTLGTEAYIHFIRNSENIDLLILDQVMPGMTGIELTREIRKIDREVPIIICSGFSEQISMDNFRDFNVQSYIMKPLNKNEMLKEVRKIIDNSKKAMK